MGNKKSPGKYDAFDNESNLPSDLDDDHWAEIPRY